MTQSSQLAVAAKYLGLIKDSGLLNYAQQRSGIIFSFIEDDKINFITVEEILSLLPE